MQPPNRGKISFHHIPVLASAARRGRNKNILYLIFSAFAKRCCLRAYLLWCLLCVGLSTVFLLTDRALIMDFAFFAKFKMQNLLAEPLLCAFISRDAYIMARKSKKYAPQMRRINLPKMVNLSYGPLKALAECDEGAYREI